MNKKIKIFGILFIAIPILFFGTGSFVKGAEDLLVPEGVLDEKIGTDLLILLLELKTIQFNSDIFNDKAFLNLKDFSTEIQPQSVGRRNPFSPIGSDPTDGTIEFINSTERGNSTGASTTDVSQQLNDLDTLIDFDINI